MTPRRRKMTVRILVIALVAALGLAVVPSVALAAPSATSSTPVMAGSRLTATQMAAWYRSLGKASKATVSIEALATYFVEEGRDEGVAGDLAFAQAMVETGYLNFSTRAPAHFNNFSGLGAVDGGSSAAWFPDARTGVRAQIQHLRAYADPTATESNLAHPLVDGRFKYVHPKGKAPTWEQFGNGVWASASNYAPVVLGVYQKMVSFAGNPPPVPPPTDDRWAPFATAGDLVAQGYRDLLAREASGAERSAGAATLANGSTAPGRYLADLIEGEGARHAQPAARLYLAALGRLPDRSGLQYWTRRHHDGTRLHRLSEQFLASSEFQRRYGNPTNSQFVELLYVNVLGRVSDPAGADYWTRRLDGGQIGRASLLIQFSESGEHQRATRSKVEASIVYLGMVLRAPDPSVLSWWATKRAVDTDLAALVDLVMGSAAYHARFS